MSSNGYANEWYVCISEIVGGRSPFTFTFSLKVIDMNNPKFITHNVQFFMRSSKTYQPSEQYQTRYSNPFSFYQLPFCFVHVQPPSPNICYDVALNLKISHPPFSKPQSKTLQVSNQFIDNIQLNSIPRAEQLPHTEH